MVWNPLQSQQTVTKSELRHGLRMLRFDGVCTQVMGVFVGGAFLSAFAVLLGASNFVIGLIASAAPLSQILQIPAIYLIEKVGARKPFIVGCSGVSRLFWVVVAGVPFLVPPELQVSTFLGAIFLYYGISTVYTLSFNSLVRDLIPHTIRGRFMGTRLAVGIAVAALVSLAAGAGADWFKQTYTEMSIYSVYFIIGAGAGLVGVGCLSQVPEPHLERKRDLHLRALIAEPFRDPNFRHLLSFLGSWNGAVNLAAPFFTVYMLKRLQLDMTTILVLSVTSQAANVLFLRLWGRLADRYSNKSVLFISGPLFMLSTALWPLTTMPEKYVLTLPLLVMIHILTGISTAGVTLCTGNIALTLSPPGKATAYLAVNAMVSGIAATAAPILGGLAATWLDGQQLTLELHWTSHLSGTSWEMPAFDVRGLDFLFLASALITSLVKKRGSSQA